MGKYVLNTTQYWKCVEIQLILIIYGSLFYKVAENTELANTEPFLL